MEIRSRASPHGFLEISRRELGCFHPLAFSRRAGSSEVLVKRLSLHGKLNGHKGCVNTVHFSPSGDLLVSGSDDRQIIFWNWVAKCKIFSYASGHLDNVFQARIMPFTDDHTVISCAADGQVRVGYVLENGLVDTKMLAKHQGRVHKLATEPGSPHIFYSCGEDGVVQHFDLRSHSATKLFSCSSFKEKKQAAHRGVRLNAIVIDPRNPNYFSIGGFDEYARVYDIRKCRWDDEDLPVNTFSPRHLMGSDNVHITGLAYSNTSELLVSYNDELVYLFQKDMGIGPNPKEATPEYLQQMNQPQVYMGHRNSQTIKGVSYFGPNDTYVVSGSDCGHIFIWKKVDGKLLRLIRGDKHVVNCLEPHPFVPILATSGLEKDIKVWSPVADSPVALLSNADEIMEANKQAREDRSALTFTPDLIMHVLRLQRRQTLAYIERRTSRVDHDSDDEDDEGEAFVLGFSDGDASSEDGLTSNSRECNIS